MDDPFPSPKRRTTSKDTEQRRPIPSNYLAWIRETFELPSQIEAAIAAELERNPAPAISPDVWTISLRSEGDGPSTEQRLRRFLKSALRAFGLRCTGFGHCVRCMLQDGPKNKG